MSLKRKRGTRRIRQMLANWKWFQAFKRTQSFRDGAACPREPK